MAYYDTIKSLAILMVCLYHFNGLNKNILVRQDFSTYTNYLFHSSLSMCVPLFFMVNGALLLNKKLDLAKHLKKTANIFILTFVWAIITLLVLIPICGDKYSLKQFISAVWNFKYDRIHYLWFFRALFSVYLLFPLIKLAYDQKENKIFYYLCFIIFIFAFLNKAIISMAYIFAYLLRINYVHKDFSLFPAIITKLVYPYSFLYFCIGGFLSVWIVENRVKIRTGLLVAIFIFALFLLFVFGVEMTRVNNEFYDTVWKEYSSLMTLIMSICFFILCSRVNYTNYRAVSIISFIGRNTLGIFLLHIIFGKAFTPYFKNTVFSNNIFANILLGIVIVFLSAVTAFFIKKIPFLRKLLTL